MSNKQGKDPPTEPAPRGKGEPGRKGDRGAPASDAASTDPLGHSGPRRATAGSGAGQSHSPTEHGSLGSPANRLSPGLAPGGHGSAENSAADPAAGHAGTDKSAGGTSAEGAARPPAARRREGIASLPFERPIHELERRIEELKTIPDVSLNGELKPLEQKRDRLLAEVYSRLTPWETVQVARHPPRPQFSDYVSGIFTDYVELHGDRLFGEDKAITTALARIGGRRVLLVGHRKGRDTKQRMACNFGCAHPEGYRKALAKMRLADRFGLPIVTMINTPGAYPGVGAEERGQAWAIAENILEMTRLRVPVICVVIGEGGSGGALGIGVGDRVLMLQYAYYSVISPEGCAAILWKDGARSADAAKALRLTSPDLLKLGVVDEIVPEPLGAAHRDPEAMMATMSATLTRHLDELCDMDPDERLALRYRRLRALGNGIAPLEAPR